ncbi:MAG: tetratricopeptide repeat protein [Bacteroidota bacterium]
MHKPILLFLLTLLFLIACGVGDLYHGIDALSKGEQWLSVHQYDSAEFYFKQTLALKGDLNGYIFLAQVKALKGEKNYAQRYIDSANFHRNDFNANYLNNRGYVQNLIGDYDAALISLFTAVELDPEMAYAHSNLGKTYFELNEEALAYKHLKKAMELDATDPYPFHYFALLQAAKGDSSTACEYLQYALEINSDFFVPIGPELKNDHKRICQ